MADAQRDEGTPVNPTLAGIHEVIWERLTEAQTKTLLVEECMSRHRIPLPQPEYQAGDLILRATLAELSHIVYK